MTVIEIAKIRLDGGTQIRVAVDDTTVTEYTESLKNGAKFPPVDVYFDGGEYWLADGFHRLAAHVKNGLDTIEAKVTEGTQREAILHAVGANSTHGLRRTNADKRRAVETLLRDEKWCKSSDRWIAKTCAVSNHFVASMRQSTGSSPSSSDGRIGQDGKTRKPKAAIAVASESKPVKEYDPAWFERLIADIENAPVEAVRKLSSVLMRVLQANSQQREEICRLIDGGMSATEALITVAPTPEETAFIEAFLAAPQSWVDMVKIKRQRLRKGGSK